MIRQGRGPDVGMTVKNVATLLPDRPEAQPENHLSHLPEANHRKAGHTATSICCKPTKCGRSSNEPLNSSRHNWRTSLRFFCSSSSVAACVCAPGDRKSTRLNSSHGYISYAVFCLKKKKQ